MKVKVSLLLTLLILPTSLYTQENTTSGGYTQIECVLKPRVRLSRKQSSKKSLYPNQPGRLTGTSTNWCGYASADNLNNPTTNSISSISGSWRVPTVVNSGADAYCAIWVGIDGFLSSTVEQIGTEHDWLSGHQEHYAWFEMYPDYSYEIVGFPVHPGDLISASVAYQGNNVFVLSLVNSTRRVSTTVPTNYTTAPAPVQRNSAEWIVEAPFSGAILPLDHFTPITFTNCTVNGLRGGISNGRLAYESIRMVTNGGATKAIPSGLSNGGKNFSVTWKHRSPMMQ